MTTPEPPQLSYTIPKFYFDTADIEFIKRTWDKLHKFTSSNTICGITTNPNALSKVNVNTMEQLNVLVGSLADLLFDIRQDGLAQLHVQLPISTMKDYEIVKWIHYFQTFPEIWAKCKINIKIPPKPSVMRIAHQSNLNAFNVTGLSDASTCLAVLHQPGIVYASLIPGRMEEAGLDATAHLRKLAYALREKHNKQIIAGSMRTVSGTKIAISYGTLPTIGTRVWNAMTDADYNEFESWWQVRQVLPDFILPEPSDERNVQLTTEFFQQMDMLGKPLYEDFISL